MPRKARIDAPGALHHIIIRGIERKDIFKDSKDYSNFLSRIGDVLLETQTPCFAWVLMNNHVHLLLRTGYRSISTVMKRLLTGYSQQFNRRYNRHGPLFQNRFKSILCEEGPYLFELVRYIHLNPLRAGNVKDLRALATYPYSGHHVLMGKGRCEWQDSDYILKLFGRRIRHATKAYIEFVARGIEIGRRPELTGGGLVRSSGGWSALIALRSVASRIMGDERILGGSDFVESVLKRANEDYEKRTFAISKGLQIDDVLRRVSEVFNLPTDSLRGAGKHRKASRARAIVCFIAVDKLGFKCIDVARILKMSPSTVSKAVTRGNSDECSREIWEGLHANSQSRGA